MQERQTQISYYSSEDNDSSIKRDYSAKFYYFKMEQINQNER